MLHLNIVLLTFAPFVFFTPVFSDARTKDVDTKIELNEQSQAVDIEIEHYPQILALDEEIGPSIDVSKPTEEHLDARRRRIIASKYLDTLESVKEDWIDPYDMGGLLYLKKDSEQMAAELTATETTSTPPTISKKDDLTPLNIKKEEICTPTSTRTFETLSVPKEKCLLDNVYITRWLKKLLLRIEMESGAEYSTISFQLDSDTLDILKQMSSSKTFEVSVLDEILSNMLAQADIKRKESYFEAAFTYHTDILKGLAYASGVAIFIYALRRSFLQRPKLTILVCGMVINIGWHWMHLYQKVKAHKHAELSSMQIPSQCKKHDLGLFEHMAEYLKSFFATSECSKYYEALLVDPFWEVSIAVAATEAATATLFQPLFASSRAVNYFLKQLFEGLPIYLTVFLIIFIFFVTLMKFGYSVRLPLFMGRIEPCHPVAGSRVEELERPTQLPKLTDTILGAVTGTKSTSVKQILKEKSSVETTSTGASKETFSQSIEYTSNEDGTGKCIYRQDSQTSIFRRATDSEEVPPGVHDKTISEEGLALRSGYFEVLNEAESLKPIQHTLNETEVKMDNKIGSKMSDDTTVSVISTKKPTAPAHLEAVAKHVPAISTQAKEVSVPNSNQLDFGDVRLDRNGELEVSKLPNSLTDSFEIIPRDDEISASMQSSRGAGPNCDTSQDILSEMHRGCRFCNSTNSIG